MEEMPPSRPWLAQLPDLHHALRTDGLMSVPTAHRLFGLPLTLTPVDRGLMASHFHGLHVHEFKGLTAQRFGQRVSVPYVALTRTPEVTEPHIVRSLLALAEARMMLRCPANPVDGSRRWEVQAHHKPSGSRDAGVSIADALCRHHHRTDAGVNVLLISVEDDSGEKERRRVQDHMITYADLGPQVWVVPTWQRQRELLDIWQALYPDRIDFYPLLSRWWTV